MNKLKIALASDLHLEFGDIDLQNTEGAEVLILSGDILIAEDLHSHPEVNYSHLQVSALMHGQQRAQRFRDFLSRCSQRFPHVIYVAGNHEFYHGKFFASLEHLRQECLEFPNVYFLERDTKVIGDVTFMGATVWTDCNRGDPLTLHSLQDMMNDYQIIRNDSLGYTKLRPAHTMERHHKTMGYFRLALAEIPEDRKVVIVGHHAPSPLSTHPRYANDTLMNGGYSSDLSEFILDHPQIKLWTHGHTHHPFDYMIGTTRVVCNPRGYVNYEHFAGDFNLQYLEV